MFNEQQQEAINTTEGIIQVVACPGAGKSTTLVSRICNLVESKIPESEILTITFTNASGEDLKNKLIKKGLKEVTVGTFHSICKDILESNGYKNLFNSPNIYSIKRDIEAVTKIKDINIEEIISWIGYQKNNMIDSNGKFKKRESEYDERFLRLAYKAYEKYCDKNDAYDFEDWLINAYKIYESGKGRKWKYVLVDESQDLNLVQHKLVKHFCSTNNIFVVGDLQQCIYEWRGSSPELFKDFDKDNPGTKVINMNINYRSCKNIVEASNNFIRPYNKDYNNYKDAEANKEEEGVIECHSFINNISEAIFVGNKIKELIDTGTKPEDIAVIYRNNANSDCIESELNELGIEYVVSNNNSFFDKKEIKGIIGILKLTVDSTNDEAFEDVIKSRFYPTTYYRGDLLGKLISESGKKNCSLYEAFMDHRWDKAYEKINANTLVDNINRLKIQNEKKVVLPKIIENIIKMFKIRQYINDKYEHTASIDKLDSLENLKLFSASHTDIKSFINFCESGITIKNKKKNNAVQLMTGHKVKGLEFETVFVIGLEEGKFPSNRASEESEARLFYVMVTRPKKNLYVSSIGNSDFYTKYKKGVESYDKSTM